VAGIGLQEGENEVLGVLGDALPVALVEDDTARPALLDQVGQVLGAEGRITTQEGVGNNAERPHVDSLAVALFKHDFGRSVTERACHASKLFRGAFQHLCDTEIRQDQLGVGGACEVEEVFRLQIFGCISKLAEGLSNGWRNEPRWTMFFLWR
jgi:hypothetical protein